MELVAVGVDQLDHAVKTAGMTAQGECGRLRIGVYALIPGSFLAELVGQYRKDYPNLDIEITEGTAGGRSSTASSAARSWASCRADRCRGSWGGKGGWDFRAPETALRHRRYSDRR